RSDRDIMRLGTELWHCEDAPPHYRGRQPSDGGCIENFCSFDYQVDIDRGDHLRLWRRGDSQIETVEDRLRNIDAGSRTDDADQAWKLRVRTFFALALLFSFHLTTGDIETSR